MKNYIENKHETDNILENFFINFGSSDSYTNQEDEEVCGIVRNHRTPTEDVMYRGRNTNECF